MQLSLKKQETFNVWLITTAQGGGGILRRKDHMAENCVRQSEFRIEKLGRTNFEQQSVLVNSTDIDLVEIFYAFSPSDMRIAPA